MQLSDPENTARHAAMLREAETRARHAAMAVKEAAAGIGSLLTHR